MDRAFREKSPAARCTIALLGAGSPAGAALARTFARTGHRVLLSDADCARARKVHAEILREHPRADAESLDCARISCWEADVIAVVLPQAGLGDLLERVRDVATGKIVLMVGPSGRSTDQLATALPHSTIVRMSAVGGKPTAEIPEAAETVRRLLDPGTTQNDATISMKRHRHPYTTKGTRS